MSGHWVLDDFVPRIGEGFKTILEDGSPLSIDLVDASPLPLHDLTPRLRMPFQIRFRGPHTHRLTQRIYLLLHSGLGELHVFLVPIGSGQDGLTYQAIFT